MNKKYILFDLDGTITDPMVGITRSVQHALKAYGIDEPDLNKLCPFIGPPLKDSFMEFYGFSSKDASDAIYVYREYFVDKGIYENKVYPGIEQMLLSLNRAGHELLVATSKPEEFAVNILKHFNLDKYFRFIGGAAMDETRVRKEEVIRYVLEHENIKDISKTVMVGDRKHDIEGGKKNGMETVGVLYGYGDMRELKEAGADYITETVRTLHELLM